MGASITITRSNWVSFSRVAKVSAAVFHWSLVFSSKQAHAPVLTAADKPHETGARLVAATERVDRVGLSQAHRPHSEAGHTALARRGGAGELQTSRPDRAWLGNDCNGRLACCAHPAASSQRGGQVLNPPENCYCARGVSVSARGLHGDNLHGVEQSTPDGEHPDKREDGFHRLPALKGMAPSEWI